MQDLDTFVKIFDTWLKELSQDLDAERLLHFSGRDIDFSQLHPSGQAAFLRGGKVLLSSLIREKDAYIAAAHRLKKLMHVNRALWENRGVELLRLGIGFLHAENTASTHENTTETGSKDNSIPECELFYINLSVSPAGNPAERDVDHSGFASNLSASFDTGGEEDFYLQLRGRVCASFTFWQFCARYGFDLNMVLRTMRANPTLVPFSVFSFIEDYFTKIGFEKFAIKQQAKVGIFGSVGARLAYEVEERKRAILRNKCVKKLAGVAQSRKSEAEPSVARVDSGNEHINSDSNPVEDLWAKVDLSGGQIDTAGVAADAGAADAGVADVWGAEGATASIALRIAQEGSCVVRGEMGDEWVKCVRIYCLLQVMRGKRVLVVSMRPRYLQTLQEEFARVGSSGVCVWVREFYKDIVACILAREKSAEVYGNLDESSNSPYVDEGGGYGGRNNEASDGLKESLNELIRVYSQISPQTFAAAAELFYLNQSGNLQTNSQNNPQTSSRDVQAENPQTSSRDVQAENPFFFDEESIRSLSRKGVCRRVCELFDVWDEAYGEIGAARVWSGDVEREKVHAYRAAEKLLDIWEKMRTMHRDVAQQANLYPPRCVRELSEQIHLLLDIKKTFGKFKPEVFGYDLDLILDVLCVDEPKGDRGIKYGKKAQKQALGARLSLRQAKALARSFLRVGGRFGGVCEALRKVKELKQLWLQNVKDGALPSVPLGLDALWEMWTDVERCLGDLSEDLRDVPFAEFEQELLYIVNSGEEIHFALEVDSVVTELLRLGLGGFLDSMREREVTCEEVKHNFRVCFLSSFLRFKKVARGEHEEIESLQERIFEGFNARQTLERAKVLQDLALRWQKALGMYPAQAQWFRSALVGGSISPQSAAEKAPDLFAALCPVVLCGVLDLAHMGEEVYESVVFLDGENVRVCESLVGMGMARDVVVFDACAEGGAREVSGKIDVRAEGQPEERQRVLHADPAVSGALLHSLSGLLPVLSSLPEQEDMVVYDCAEFFGLCDTNPRGVVEALANALESRGVSARLVDTCGIVVAGRVRVVFDFDIWHTIVNAPESSKRVRVIDILVHMRRKTEERGERWYFVSFFALVFDFEGVVERICTQVA